MLTSRYVQANGIKIFKGEMRWGGGMTKKQKYVCLQGSTEKRPEILMYVEKKR